jgi:hypothetical protein
MRIDKYGTLLSWRDDSFGQLGNRTGPGLTVDQASPTSLLLGTFTIRLP